MTVVPANTLELEQLALFGHGRGLTPGHVPRGR
jgi:hypothetical protein